MLKNIHNFEMYFKNNRLKIKFIHFKKQQHQFFRGTIKFLSFYSKNINIKNEVEEDLKTQFNF